MNDRSHTASLLAVFVRRYGSAFGFVILCIYFALATENHTFTNPANLLNIADQVSVNLILAVGMTFVIISGGIDLSVGSVLALGGTVAGGVLAQGLALGGLTLSPGHPTALLALAAILCGLAVGTACGLFNSLVITRFSIHPFLATLAMMLLARGIANVYVGGGRFGNLPEVFTTLCRERIGPVPRTAVLAAVVVLIGYLLLRRTVFGRRVYAIGGNEEAARLSGVPVARTKIIIFTAAGLLAALGGIVSASTLGAGDPTTGYYAELDAIAAVVLGGASLSGGVGGIGGTVLGALLIGVLNNGLGLMKVDEFYQLMARGLVILGAVIIDQTTKGK
jgi:ribose/xylose/arabinose/galactoside ABC-type transport system permease subunit